MKPWMMILLGIGGVAILYLILQNSATSSSGFSVVQANPSSVAAVEQGNASQQQIQATTQQAQIASNTQVLGDIFSYLTSSNSNAAQTAQTSNNNQTSVALNASNNGTAQAIAQFQSAAADYSQGVNAQAQTTIAQIAGQTNQNIAGINASAQQNEVASQIAGAEQVSANQLSATQDQDAAAHAISQTNSKAGVVGSLLSGISSGLGSLLGKSISDTSSSSVPTTANIPTSSAGVSGSFVTPLTPDPYINDLLTGGGVDTSGNLPAGTLASTSSRTNIAPVPYQILSGDVNGGLA